ncbi:efflux RND transporter periplasmic adaptor subunit [Colwellia sp. RSH04]|uniref:efflux RND transporter periplasmic adaptor subunit n=1 Tax=Colwellia sp. RSH04 TaxID=2305464 RepID=UPI000E5900FA|nr:efflux RND transporter periplasmic adaptor subunit [Colwellia sp. RSH04]RHW77307.1 HlyD family efflux transporter periplasmic adaptor subunit [Colwellia sp. RSH04]
MKNNKILSSLSLAILLSFGNISSNIAIAASTPAVEEAEPEKGPNRGRMLRDGKFALELAIFETGVPPEFRVWVTNDGKAVAPTSVDLNIKLTRLGDGIDDINFVAQGDILKGDMVIYEPHSFVVNINATYQGKTHQWQYDNLEGRTTIEQAVADAMEIQTEIAGAATLHQTIPAFGSLSLPVGSQRNIAARFEGEITKLHVGFGDKVKKGQTLLTVESNESLKPYAVKSPTSGVITQQLANSGEQTNGRNLLTITNNNLYIAKLAIYPTDYQKVKIGSPVTLEIDGVDAQVSGVISFTEPKVRDDQARIVWVEVPNEEKTMFEGSFVKAQIEVATFDVPLAVKRVGLQAFRDFTVVYAKVGEQYEVRMLELGRKDGQWIEVLGGLKAGTEYVTDNSYILKADIEKSGASHDH